MSLKRPEIAVPPKVCDCTSLWRSWLPEMITPRYLYIMVYSITVPSISNFHLIQYFADVRYLFFSLDTIMLFLSSCNNFE